MYEVRAGACNGDEFKIYEQTPKYNINNKLLFTHSGYLSGHGVKINIPQPNYTSFIDVRAAFVDKWFSVT